MQKNTKHHNYNSLFFFLIILFSCNAAKNEGINTVQEYCNTNKIKFKLTIFDKNGLIGDENNKVALDYEFCVPNTSEILKTINEIDSNIKPLRGKGRTKCAENHIVMIGNSYNKDIKKILCKLSQLDYVTEINQVFWE